MGQTWIVDVSAPKRSVGMSKNPLPYTTVDYYIFVHIQFGSMQFRNWNENKIEENERRVIYIFFSSSENISMLSKR